MNFKICWDYPPRNREHCNRTGDVLGVWGSGCGSQGTGILFTPWAKKWLDIEASPFTIVKSGVVHQVKSQNQGDIWGYILVYKPWEWVQVPF